MLAKEMWFVLLNVVFSESISQASFCLSDVYLFVGTTFDKAYHVVACTVVLGNDAYMSPRSVDRG